VPDEQRAILGQQSASALSTIRRFRRRDDVSAQLDRSRQEARAAAAGRGERGASASR
jgi:hypothetical protein